MFKNDRVSSAVEPPSASLPERVLVSDFRTDGLELDENIRNRYSRIYEGVKKLKGREGIKDFVFNCGFDGDGGLGVGLNQSSVDFILWLASSYHDLIHIYRCGAQGSDQVQRMAQKLYGPDGFFHDIHDYVGHDPLFVESLPTADSVADPSGVITYLKKIKLFDDARFGYMGAACWATKRNMPGNLPVPEQTVHGEPMGTVYYDNLDGSMREKVELMLKYGRVAYERLFERLEMEHAVPNKGLGFLGAHFGVYGHPGTILQDFDSPATESEHLFWCILQTLHYYRTCVMRQSSPPTLFKEEMLMDTSKWNIGEFKRMMTAFYGIQSNLIKVHGIIAQYNYQLVGGGTSTTFNKIRVSPWVSMEQLFLLSFCFNMHFNLYYIREGVLQKVEKGCVAFKYTDYLPNDAEIVQHATPLVVNLMTKKQRFTVLLPSSHGLLVNQDQHVTNSAVSPPSVPNNAASTPAAAAAADDNDAGDLDDLDDELARLPPFPGPPIWHPLLPYPKPVVTDLTGNTHTLPGFSHFNQVDWNEYLTVPNANVPALDKNTLQIVENGLKMPVKTHMSQVRDRFKLVVVDPKFFSGLFGYNINGFRGTMVPSGVVSSENKRYEYREEDKNEITGQVDATRRFFRIFFIGDFSGRFDVPQYAYNISYFTDAVGSDGTRYANNFVREKSAFDHFFHKNLEEHSVKVKISPVLQEDRVEYVEVSMNNDDFLPNGVGAQTGMCRHRYKLRRTDWCGKYVSVEDGKYFKLEIKHPYLYGNSSDGYPSLGPYKPKFSAEPIQAEESYYLFFHSVRHCFCIINQYQFEKHTTRTKKPWTNTDLKAFAVSGRKLQGYYNDNVWKHDIVETFFVKGALKIDNQNMHWSSAPGTISLKYGDEEVYTSNLPIILNTLTVRYSIDKELLRRQNKNIEVQVKTEEDKARMWVNVMQSKPWIFFEGQPVCKRGLEDYDGEISESEKLTWKPPELQEGDTWWFLDEVDTSRTDPEELPTGKRGTQTRRLLRESVMEFAKTIKIGGTFYWNAGQLHIETNDMLNPILQGSFNKYLRESLPLKLGEMDLCIPEYNMCFEAMHFFNLGLPDENKSDFLYNLCMSVYTALLSLWKQPNAFCRLDFKQMSMLNYLMTNAWSTPSKFLKAIEDRLQQPEIRQFLERKTVTQTYILETWRLVMPGILSCVRVSTSDVYTKDLIQLANKALLEKMEKIKEEQETLAIRQKSDFDFMRYVHTFDEAYRQREEYLTVLPPTLPSTLPEEYENYNNATELTHKHSFECSSFDLDFANLKKFRFEDERPNTHSFDFNPPDSTTGDSLKKYISAYDEALESCDSFHCLYTLCMMIRYPDDTKYHGLQSRFFYVVLCELWANVFQRCFKERLERIAKTWINKIHATLCWLVRRALAKTAYVDYVFYYTQAALTRLQHEDTISIDINVVYEKAMLLKSSQYIVTKEWLPDNLNFGMDKIREAAQKLIIERITASAGKWDGVMFDMFKHMSIPVSHRQAIRHKIASAFEKEGILEKNSEMFKTIKVMVWFPWDYNTQRDVYRDNMLSRYLKQIQKLRVVNIRDSVTRYYNTIDLGHVNTLRETQKSFADWKDSRETEEGFWKLHPSMNEGFYHARLWIDMGQYAPQEIANNRTEPAPSDAAGNEPPPDFPSLPGNVDSSVLPAGSANVPANQGHWGNDKKKTQIEPAVLVPVMDFSQFMDDSDGIFTHRRIMQVVLTYRGRFAPLISPNMSSKMKIDLLLWEEKWKDLFRDPSEYNLGVFKIDLHLTEMMMDKNIEDLVVFKAQETESFIRSGKSMRPNKARHIIFFTSACNVFHYIRSIPLTLKYYKFNRNRDESKDLERLRDILSKDSDMSAGGQLYDENIVVAEQGEWQLLQNLMQIAHEDDFDEEARTYAVKSEISELTKNIKDAKLHMESVYNESCIVPISEEHAKLINALKTLERRTGSNAQARLLEIKKAIADHEAKREEARVQLEQAKNKRIEEGIRSLDGMTKNLRSLQTDVFDIQFKFNEDILNAEIKAAEDLLKTFEKKDKNEQNKKDREEVIKSLRQLRAQGEQNKKNHEAKLKLLAGRTELEAEQYLRDSKELARINAMQEETRTNTHDIYVRFLIAQQERLKKRWHRPDVQPEIHTETEDLSDLLQSLGVKADNFWIAPLWMMENFIRDRDKLEEGKLTRKYADHVRRLVQDKKDIVVSYCGCIKYFLYNINATKGMFVFEELVGGVQLPSLIGISESFSGQNNKPAVFLGYDAFSAVTREIVARADKKNVLSVICSAANLNLDVYEPYYNLKCALVAEDGSNDFASCIMLDHNNKRNYQTSTRFFFAEDEGIHERTMVARGEAQFVLTDSKRVVIRGQNKPVFYVDLGRRKLMQNLGWSDGSDKFSFFKSLASDGFYTDAAVASYEFVFAVMRDISRRLRQDKHVFSVIMSERMEALHEIFQYQVSKHGLKTPFHKLHTNRIWVYYCQLLCAGLPAQLLHFSEYFHPSEAELQCFCDQLHTRFEITKMENEAEFSVVDFASENSLTVSKSHVHEDWYKQMPEHAGKSVVRMLHFKKTTHDSGVFCRLIDCVPSTPSLLPDTINVSKNEAQDMLTAGSAWEGRYTRLSESKQTKVTDIRNAIKNCQISGVFSDDIFVSDSENIFILWRVSDSWIIQTLQNFMTLAQWFSNPSGKNPNQVVAVARIDYNADIRGECTWYIKKSETCKISVSTTGNERAVVTEPFPHFTASKVPVEPFKLHFLNAGCSRWPTRAKDPEFSKRLKGLCMFRQEGGLVPMRLWQANNGFEADMEEDGVFYGTIRRRRTRREQRLRNRRDDDSSDDESSEDESNQRTRQRGDAWTEDEVGGSDNFAAKQRTENKKQSFRQSNGKGNNSADRQAAKAAREAARAETAAGGGGMGKHVRNKNFVTIQSTGGRRGGMRPRVGAKNICPNRMFGVTLFGDRKAREAFWNHEGDAKNYDYYSAYNERQQRHREAEQEDAAELRRNTEYFRRIGLINSTRGQFQVPIHEVKLFLGFQTPYLQVKTKSDHENYTVINEDLKPTFMLTTGLFESIVTLETFGSRDCVSIKLIQGTNEECITLALFLSCFFEKSTTLCMFDQFTDCLTFAGKGFVPEMAEFWDSTALLMSVADITPEAFLSLKEKIPGIWDSRKYFMDDDDEMLLHEHEAEIRANSTKLWWAHHRSLTIAALAFVTCSLYGRVWPCKYITEEEAWKSTHLLNRNRGSHHAHDLLEELLHSPFGGQLQSIFGMAEFIAVQHPMRPIYTKHDRDVHATKYMFDRFELVE